MKKIFIVLVIISTLCVSCGIHDPQGCKYDNLLQTVCDDYYKKYNNQSDIIIMQNYTCSTLLEYEKMQYIDNVGQEKFLQDVFSDKNIRFLSIRFSPKKGGKVYHFSTLKNYCEDITSMLKYSTTVSSTSHCPITKCINYSNGVDSEKRFMQQKHYDNNDFIEIVIGLNQ